MNLRRYLLFLAVAVAMVVNAQNHPLDIPGADKTKVGIYIENLKTGEVLADINGDDLFIPASVMKSVTSATALATFVPDGRFVTSVIAKGNINNGALYGDVVVQAIGDPTIESTHFSDTRGFPGKIVKGLKSLGIDTIKGVIIIDEGRFVDATAPYGWASGDLSAYYGTLVHGANYQGNASGKSAVKDPGVKMMRHIVSAIGESGIVLENSEDIEVADMENLVYQHQSPKVYDILHSLMIRSDNMFAEAMLRSMAEGETRQVALDYEKRLWADRGLDMSRVKIYDGSGLSRQDRLSPKWVASLYKWMSRSDMGREYSDLFPRAGREGTMKSFLKGTRLEGRLATKTGSMSGIQGYGGYLLDKNGKATHAVVIFVNDFTCDRSRLRAELERYLLDTLP